MLVFIILAVEPRDFSNSTILCQWFVCSIIK